MNRPIVLNFDNSSVGLNDVNRIELQDWQDAVRFGCSIKQYRLLQSTVCQRLPEHYGTVLMGSGDFHHISLLLIENAANKLRAEEQIEVVIFDNHPDNMRYLFGIHCGSWVSYVANLPYVSHVHVLGITSNDIGLAHFWENRLTPLLKGKLTYWSMDVNVAWAKRFGLKDAFRQFASPKELTSAFLTYQNRMSRPIYLSIDKDVLSPDIVHTNWDQGRLDMSDIMQTITALKPRIIGSDITGDVSFYRYKNYLKRFLSALDKQPTISGEELLEWQKGHDNINQTLIDALND